MPEVEELEKAEAELREITKQLKSLDKEIAEASIPEEKTEKFNEFIDEFTEAHESVIKAFSTLEHLNAGLRSLEKKGSRFKFFADEAVYNKAEFQIKEEDGEKSLKAVDSVQNNVVDGERNYYWIEDTETDRKFKVPDHPTGTEIMIDLAETETPLEDLEEHEDVEEVEKKQEVYE